MADEKTKPGKKSARRGAAPAKDGETSGADAVAGHQDTSEKPAPAPLPESATARLPRLPPLAGRYASGAGVTLRPVEPRRRFSLRVGPDAHEAVQAALGFALPARPKSSAAGGGVSALWLGPDEWLLIGTGEAAGSAIADRLSEVAGISLVDVSHRSTAVLVEGPAAEAVIATGCPQDIRRRAFPVGACGRTVLSKAEIVLWRTGEQRFEIECWRSFADYVWTFLEEAAVAPAV